MSRVPQRNGLRQQNDGRRSIEAAPAVQSFSHDAVVALARLLARASARDLMLEHNKIHLPIESQQV